MFLKGTIPHSSHLTTIFFAVSGMPQKAYGEPGSTTKTLLPPKQFFHQNMPYTGRCATLQRIHWRLSHVVSVKYTGIFNAGETTFPCYAMKKEQYEAVIVTLSCSHKSQQK